MGFISNYRRAPYGRQLAERSWETLTNGPVLPIMFEWQVVLWGNNSLPTLSERNSLTCTPPKARLSRQCVKRWYSTGVRRFIFRQAQRLLRKHVQGGPQKKRKTRLFEVWEIIKYFHPFCTGRISSPCIICFSLSCSLQLVDYLCRLSIFHLSSN